jgi:hypothetical protein
MNPKHEESLSDEYTAEWRIKRARAMRSVLGSVARRKCDKKNCGSVCLCDSCNARLALERYDPEWRP